MKTYSDLVCDIDSLQVELTDLRAENDRLKKAVDEAEEIIERMLEGEGLDRRDYHNGREWLKEFGTKE